MARARPTKRSTVAKKPGKTNPRFQGTKPAPQDPAPKPTSPQVQAPIPKHSIPTPKSENDDDVPTDPSLVFIGDFVLFLECKFPKLDEKGQFVYDDKGKLEYETTIRNITIIETIKDYWDAINMLSQYRTPHDSYFLQSLRETESEEVLRECRRRGEIGDLVHDYNKHQYIWVIARYNKKTFNPEDGFYQFLQRYMATFKAYGKYPASKKERTANSGRLNLMASRANEEAGCVPMDSDFQKGYIPRFVFEFIRGSLDEFGVCAVSFSKTILSVGGRNGTPCHPCKGYQLRIAIGTPDKALAPPNLITEEQADLFVPQLEALDNYLKTVLVPRCLWGKIQHC
ncbi:Hypothetical protein MVR_LOCUS234 [uncultured virus]|nr:Hypothetical protein MVR_LOCUS234 [uncultured virus]